MNTIEERATYRIGLWLKNDEGLYELTNEIVGAGGPVDQLAEQVRNVLQELAESLAPAVFKSSFVADLFGLAWHAVDFSELVEKWAEGMDGVRVENNEVIVDSEDENDEDQ